ncbi:MAG: CDGSH iron-sulfur domain-containing protein [Bacteroidales bacterium]|nr:CDGSH iron-sulfur domain-containing protein [Bacteroidales bacterium]
MQPLHTKIEEKKQVFWCMCKHSASKPFCDGSHRQL